MVLNGFKVRNINDFSDYFNIFEVWKKKEDFVLFLNTLISDEVALEDVRIADEREGKNESSLSRISLLREFKNEDYKSIYQSIFLQEEAKKEDFGLLVRITQAIASIDTITEEKDKVLLVMMYLLQNREIEEAEILRIKALFPNLKHPDLLLESGQISIENSSSRFDFKLYIGSSSLKAELKEIKNSTNEIKIINILHREEIAFSYSLNPGETMYCVMAEGRFIRRLKTISMGRTHGAYLVHESGIVHSIPLINTRGSSYQYPDMISFAADIDRGILGFALPSVREDRSNVMAAVDFQNIPRNGCITTASLYGSQYLMLQEDGTPITNVYGAENFKNLIDGVVRLNTVIGITSERTLVSTAPYEFKASPIMSIAASNHEVAAILMDGSVLLNGNPMPVSGKALEIGLSQNDLYVLKQDGELFAVSREGERQVEGIGHNIREISVSDTGIMFRTKDDSIGIYYFETGLIQKLKG